MACADRINSGVEPTLQEILANNGMERKLLNKRCNVVVRDYVFMYLSDWKTFGYRLGLSQERIIAIKRENDTEDQRKIALYEEWVRKNGNSATYLRVAEALHVHGRRDLIETMCERMESWDARGVNTQSTPGAIEDTDYSGVNVGEKIDSLEKHFRHLRKRFEYELKSQPHTTVEMLLSPLTMLPFCLILEYKASVAGMLDSVSTVDKFFQLLNLVTTFIDYHLLKYLITELSSQDLQDSMIDYEKDIQVFFEDTTIAQLMKFFPGQGNPDPNLATFMMRINHDPKLFTLRDLNEKRSRICGQFKLSECVFALIGLKSGNSFLAVWSVHRILVKEIIKSARQIDQTIYEREDILSASIDGISLFSSKGYKCVGKGFLPAQTVQIQGQILPEKCPSKRTSAYTAQNGLMDQGSSSQYNHERAPKHAKLDPAIELLVLAENGPCVCTALENGEHSSSQHQKSMTFSVLKSQSNSETSSHQQNHDMQAIHITAPSPLSLTMSTEDHHGLSGTQSLHENKSSTGEQPSLNHHERESDVYKSFVSCHEILVTGLSLDPLIVSDALISNCFIPETISASISTCCKTQYHKATILVECVEKVVKLNPAVKFEEFLRILSTLPWTKDIVTLLRNKRQGKLDRPEDYTTYLKSIAVCQVPPRDASKSLLPPLSIEKVFRLALIKADRVRVGEIDNDLLKWTITGKLDDILETKVSIELEDILSEKNNCGERRVVLIEGAPGSGKTTLALHFYHQWGKGKLFQQFKVVVFLSLREPSVQKAKGVADLLPGQNDFPSSVDEICQTYGRDVLFILDGWDEFPSDMRNDSESFIYRTLLASSPGASNQTLLHRSSVIVTSRPISSSNLHEIVSSRIEVLGFTPSELEKFFAESLGGNAEAVKNLIESIQEHPEVASSCYLPLNASILVHIFKVNNKSIPSSLYGIFHDLIRIHICRHYLKDSRRVSIKSLNEKGLPEDIKGHFNYISELAFQGLKEERFAFSTLRENTNTLGLLQRVESVFICSTETTYHFTHLAVQELLAAQYMSTKPKEFQESHLTKFLSERRFISVLQFYAAITKFKGVEDTVVKFILQSKSFRSSSNDKSILLFLLRCLYEVRNSEIFQSVVDKFKGFGLNLGRWSSAVTLSPADCLYIGHFLSQFCISRSDRGAADVFMINCGVTDTGCEFLIRGMLKCFGAEIKTQLSLNLGLNDIHAEGASHLSKLLSTKYLWLLALSRNGTLSDEGAFYLAEGLKNNVSVERLIVSVCGFTSKGAAYIATALKSNTTLCHLDIKLNTLYDKGAQCLAEALEVNTSLTKLDMESCGITNIGVEGLGKSLELNRYLETLIISNDFDGPKIFEDTRGFPSNVVTEKGVSALTESLKVNGTLKLLQVPFGSEISKCMQEAINETRIANRCDTVEVKAKYP